MVFEDAPAPACFACDHPLAARARYCSQCGAPQAAPESRLPVSGDTAERRQVTLLFCDLVGSTRLSQQLEAETYRELLLAYQRAVAAVIAQFQGHVAQYLGDGILAYFGYPSAGDDDAERAVRAGYEIHRALARLEPIPGQGQARLIARVGIHTGAAVVAQIGSGGPGERMALGETSNIAARLQGLAEPGSTVISDATLQLVAGMFITRDLGTPVLKDIERALRAHQVVQPSGVRTRLEASATLSPFVGREAELALLRSRWEAVREGRGQALLISADPGLGKSRLVLSLREHLRADPHTWLECRASPQTRNSAFQPAIELIERALTIREGDSAAWRIERLEGSLASVGIDLDAAIPLLAPLLGLALPPRYRASALAPELKFRRLIEFLVRWILALAKLQPLVLVFEDLHWADPSTRELIAGLIEGGVPQSPLFLLFTARPEYSPPTELQDRLTSLPLAPLPAHAIDAMLQALIGARSLPAEVVAMIRRRAGGVPLFAEELTKMLLASGQFRDTGSRLELVGAAADLSVPATLQDSLMARLDRLNDAKSLAQLCAVVGRECPYPLLRALVDYDEPSLLANLVRLTDSGLLYQRGVLPEASFSFKHALIQDTAYASLLKSVRQRLHGHIAEILKHRFPAQVSASPELLAEHFEQACQPGPAVKYLKLACDKALQRTANSEAVVHAEHALALLRTLPGEPQWQRLELDLLLTLGICRSASAGYGDAECEQLFERTRVLCATVDDPMLRTRALTSLWLTHIHLSRLDPALAIGHELTALGTSLEVRQIEAIGQTMQAFSLYFLGQPGAGRGKAEAALVGSSLALSKAAIRAVGQDSAVAARLSLSRCLWLLGYPDQALQRSDEAIALARALEHPYSLAIAHCNTSTWIPLLRRQPQGVPEICRELLELSTAYGFTDFHATGLVHLGFALCLDGEVEPGLKLVRETQALQSDRNTRPLQAGYFSMEAEICLGAGRLDEAGRALARSFAVAEAYQTRYWLPDQHRVRAELLLRSGAGDEAAETSFRTALALADEMGARSLELRAATGLARLWQRRGRETDARRLLQPLCDRFGEGRELPDFTDALAVIASVEQAA